MFGISACGSSPAPPSGEQVSAAIRPSLERSIASQGARLMDLSCRPPSDGRATCRAGVVLDEEIPGALSDAPVRPVAVLATLRGDGAVSWRADRVPRFTAQGGPRGSEGVDPVYAWARTTCLRLEDGGPRWFAQAARVMGREIARSSPSVRAGEASSAVRAALRRSCRAARNAGYAPGAAVFTRISARLAGR